MMTKTWVSRVLYFCLAGVLIALAWTIPFVFESQTMYYKFGIEKVLLRAAKISGLTAAVLLLFQPVLAARFSFLDKVFGLDRLYFFHRRNGLLLLFFVLLHPFLILAAEGFTLFPLEVRYWPEFLGLVLAVVLLFMVAVALVRPRIGMKWEAWSKLHTAGAVSVFVMMFVHVRFVSSTFESGWPVCFLVAAAAAVAGVLGAGVFRRSPLFSRKWQILSVRQAGEDACAIDVQRPADKKFRFFPGQFAFITPLSRDIGAEEHPFTIASSPSNQASVQFIVRGSGDFTGRFPLLKPGDALTLDGPFGRFSHVFANGGSGFLFVAGGIGITPMLSMLRYMRDTGDSRKTVLVWSNRTPSRIIFPEEFSTMEKDMPNLSVIHRFTRGNPGSGNAGRIDQSLINRVAAGFESRPGVFVCGPRPMTRAVGILMKNAGFPASRVYTEHFVL